MITQWMKYRVVSVAVLLAAGTFAPAQPARPAPAPALADADLEAIGVYSITTKEGLAVREKLETFVTSSGQNRAALADLQKKLLVVLAAPETTTAGRDLILRAVHRMGFCDNVPAVAALLTDTNSSHMACNALEGLADPRVDDVLLTALPKTEGNAKAGIITALGLRRSSKAVSSIVPLIGSADSAVADAALVALGRIGNTACAEALLKPTTPALEMKRQAALALCLNALPSGEVVRFATPIFDDAKAPAYLRAAALRALILNDGGNAPAWLAKGISDPALKVREAAARVAAVEATSPAVAAAIVAVLGSAAPEDQVRLLGALAQRQERSAAPTAVALLKAPDASVRQAAAAALVEVGGPDQVAALVEMLDASETRDAAAAALANIRAPGTSRKLASVASSSPAPQRARLISIVGARGGADALPEIAKYVSDNDAAVRKEAWRALRDMARPELVDAYLVLLPKATESERDTAAQAVMAALRQAPPEPRSAALVAAWKNADASLRPTLATIMTAYPEPASVPLLVAALDDANPAVQESAVRALAEWPDAAPMESLAAKALSLPDEKLRTVALRGAVRQMGQTPGVDPKARLIELFRKTPDEAGRKTVSNALVERLGVDAFDALESLFNDPQVGPSARAAYVALYDKAKGMTANELDPDEWKAKASHNSGGAKLAFDGKKQTRWETGTEQQPGMWFAVDLGRTAALTAVDLEYSDSPSDGPAGYKVFTSLDGQSWAGPIAQGKGPDRRLTIAFANSPIARWIKIEQTGNKPGLYWSIHELRVRSGLDPARLAAVAKKAEELKAAK